MRPERFARRREGGPEAGNVLTPPSEWDVAGRDAREEVESSIVTHRKCVARQMIQ